MTPDLMSVGGSAINAVLTLEKVKIYSVGSHKCDSQIRRTRLQHKVWSIRPRTVGLPDNVFNTSRYWFLKNTLWVLSTLIRSSLIRSSYHIIAVVAASWSHTPASLLCLIMSAQGTRASASGMWACHEPKYDMSPSTGSWTGSVDGVNLDGNRLQ